VRLSYGWITEFVLSVLYIQSQFSTFLDIC